MVQISPTNQRVCSWSFLELKSAYRLLSCNLSGPLSPQLSIELKELQKIFQICPLDQPLCYLCLWALPWLFWSCPVSPNLLTGPCVTQHPTLTMKPTCWLNEVQFIGCKYFQDVACAGTPWLLIHAFLLDSFQINGLWAPLWKRHPFNSWNRMISCDASINISQRENLTLANDHHYPYWLVRVLRS